MEKRYIGDAVYASVDTMSRLVLTTEDGLSATNTIIFEPEVLESLERFIHDWRKAVIRGEEDHEVGGQERHG